MQSYDLDTSIQTYISKPAVNPRTVLYQDLLNFSVEEGDTAVTVAMSSIAMDFESVVLLEKPPHHERSCLFVRGGGREIVLQRPEGVHAHTHAPAHGTCTRESDDKSVDFMSDGIITCSNETLTN